MDSSKVCRLCLKEIPEETKLLKLNNYVKIIQSISKVSFVTNDLLPNKICVSCVSLLLVANMVRVSVVEAQEHWTNFLKSNAKLESCHKDSIILETDVEKNIETCRICMKDILSEDKISSIFLLPKYITETFLNIQSFYKCNDIPKKVCKECNEKLKITVRVLRVCKTMKDRGITDNCTMCNQYCRLRNRKNMGELCDFICKMRNVNDAFETEWIRKSRYCDSCIKDVNIIKQVRYKSHKIEEALKIQFEKYIKPPDCDLLMEIKEEVETIMVTEFSETEANCFDNLVVTMEVKEEDEEEVSESFISNVETIEDESDHNFFDLQLNQPPSQLLLKCPHCKHTYTHEPDLYRHIDLMHFTEGTVCSECGLKLKDLPSLRKHKLRLHYKLMEYLCDICGRECPNKAKFDLHYAIHFDDRNFVCHLCGFGSKTPKSLELHMRTHNGDKRYACEHCGKRFVHHSDMKRHTYIHTGNFPYVCAVCKKGFAKRNFLRNHEQSHEKSAGKLKK